MTSKHTPGPWHLDETFVDGQWGNPSHWVCEIVGPDNSRIVADIPEYRTYEEDAAELEANARLIAAAPEMAQALDDLIREVVLSDVPGEYVESHFRQWIDNARAALVKAGIR